MDGIVQASTNSTNQLQTIELEAPFDIKETIEALVYTVSRCNDEAGPMQSNPITAIYAQCGKYNTIIGFRLNIIMSYFCLQIRIRCGLLYSFNLE